MEFTGLLDFLARLPGLRAFVYLVAAVRFRLATSEAPTWRNLVADYPQWRESLRHRSQPIADHLPWITFGAIHFLETRLTRATRVFEFGSGGSTIFFAEHARHVVAVEHDRDWSDAVTRTLRAHGYTNAMIQHVAPVPDPTVWGRDPADPDAYVSSDPRFAGKSFRGYVSAIDLQEDAALDVILIDGRARPSCFRHALRKLAPGGIVLLDNADRPHYAYIGKALSGPQWERHDFAGAGPYNSNFWKTTAWVHRS